MGFCAGIGVGEIKAVLGFARFRLRSHMARTVTYLVFVYCNGMIYGTDYNSFLFIVYIALSTIYLLDYSTHGL